MLPSSQFVQETRLTLGKTIMSNNTAVRSKTLLGALFAVLSVVSGLASCGGGSSPTAGTTPTSAGPGSTSTSTSTSNAASASTVPPGLFATATPTLIASGAIAQTATISWSSTDSTSCSSSPIGITGTSGSFTTPPLSSTTTYTITCEGPAGQKSKRVTVARAPATIVTSIGAQQASCAAEFVVGTPYYYCDCGKGAAANCVAGDDANAGTNPAAPRKTIANAIAKLASLSGSNTLRFCKGGAFDAQGSLNMPTTSCAPGSTCTDFREYDSPAFTSTAKPIVNSPPGGVALINIMGNRGGLRFLNLNLRGNGTFGNVGMFLYSGVHDVNACNLDIDGFRLGVQQVPGITKPDPAQSIPPVTNITLTGNNFTNNVAAAYLGSGMATVISKNAFLNNGSGNVFDHSIYVSAANLVTEDLVVSENYIFGQIGDKCLGNVLGVHGKLPRLKIKNNVLEIDESADTMGCYGIALDHGAYNSYADFTEAVVSANTISNTGGIGIAVSNCADCFIENNLLSFNAISNYGIAAGVYEARTTCPNGTVCLDVVNTRNTIRNNTIWFGPNATYGMTGIQVRNEGTGHIVANNSVTYTSTQASSPAYCFDYTLPITSYAFIDNNHCYSAATHKWEKTNGATLAAWQAYSSFDLASSTGAPAFVNSVIAPYDFHPTGLPLLGAGSSAHAPATDINGTPFLIPPAIGAYE